MEKPTIDVPRHNTHRGFARRILPYAVTLAVIGGSSIGAHFYFTQQTEHLHRTLQRVEGQNAYLQRQLTLAQQQLRESDEHIQEQEATLARKVEDHNTALATRVRERETALTQRVQEHEAALVQKVEERNAALAKQVQQASERAESIGSTIAVINAEHQRLRSASAAVEETARRYHAQAGISLVQLIDNANALFFEPEKHYALFTPSGLKVYPLQSISEGKISRLRDKSSSVMPYRAYFISDNLFASASLVDRLIYLSHSAEMPTTSRGKVLVHPASAFADISKLIDKERHGEHAFVAQLLDAAQRNPYRARSPGRGFEFQLIDATVNKAYLHFLTGKSAGPADRVLFHLSYFEEPLEFESAPHQVSLAYEALALIGAETFCPEHRDTAVTAFAVVFDTITAQQSLGIGRYKSFTGNSFTERAASLATISRREFAEIAPAALAAYKTGPK